MDPIINHFTSCLAGKKPHFKMKFMAWRLKGVGLCANSMITNQVVNGKEKKNLEFN